jgi:hypothetical protein
VWADIRCVATDGAPVYNAVLEAVLPGVPRILCLWHIDENIDDHLRLKLGSSYAAFHSAWDTVASSTRTEELFEEGWRQMLSDHPTAAEYLSRYVHPNRQRWCHVWTRQYTTFGARTTQRCESVNSVLKRILGRVCSLSQLVDAVVAISRKWVERRRERLHNARLANHASRGPVYEDAVVHLTREAAEMVHNESAYASNYDVHYFERLPDGCSAALSAHSKARANFIYLFLSMLSRLPSDAVPQSQPSYSGQSMVNTTSHSGQQVVNKRSKGGKDVVKERSSCGQPIVSTASTRNAVIVDAYHPHSFLDIPEGAAYYVRRRFDDDSDPTITHWVRVREGSATCTDCHHNSNYLLPCRHILAVNRVCWPKSQLFFPGQCHRRWWLGQGSAPLVTSSGHAHIAYSSRVEPCVDSGDYDTIVERSNDSIYIEWRAAADYAAGFIQQRGESGLRQAKGVLNQLIEALKQGGGEVTTQLLHQLISHCRHIRSKLCDNYLIFMSISAQSLMISPDCRGPIYVLAQASQQQHEKKEIVEAVT